MSRSATVGGLVLGAWLAFSASATAAPTISFSASAGNSAGWVNGVDAPGDSDGQAIRLSFATGSAAAAILGNVGPSPPSSPPSFWFRPAHGFPAPSNGDGALAYVQIFISFSDSVIVSSTSEGDVSSPWTAEAWRLVGGPQAVWGTDACLAPGCGDGGSHPIPPCRFGGGTYQATIACPLADGATVTGASVSAAFFGQGRGPDVYVDDLSYDGTTFTTGGPATTAPVANPWPAKTPTVAHLSLEGIARVNRRTGIGKVAARCPANFAPCHFHLKLTTRHHDRTLGRVFGTLSGATGWLTVRLNAKGRALLRAKRTIRCDLSAFPGSPAVKRGSRLTVKTLKARAGSL